MVFSVRKPLAKVACPLTIAALTAIFAAAAGAADLQSAIHEFKLPNGLRVVVAERPGAPAAAIHLHASGGLAAEPPGKAGLARLFERLPLHGSREVGSRDWNREKAALDDAEAAWKRVEAARARVPPMDPVDLQTLEVHAKMALERALRESRPAFVPQILDRNSVQARFDTFADSFEYSFLLPSNRVEVVIKLIAEWLRAPVFRYLQQDLAGARDQARRSLQAADPIEQAVRAMAREAFQATPYAVFGAAPEYADISSADLDQFFRVWFAPSNLVLAVSGHVTAGDIQRMAEAHLGRVAAGTPAPKPEAAPPGEPSASKEEIRVTEASRGVAVVGVGFFRPPVRHPDHAALLAAHALLTDAQTGLLKDEVAENKLRIHPAVAPVLPGRVRPGLLAVVATPGPGLSFDELEKLILSKVERLRTEPLPEDLLAPVRARLRLDRMRALQAPTGLAAELARAAAETRDWKHAFDDLAALASVTPAEVQRVAREYLTAERRVVVHQGPGAGKTP